MGVLEKEKIFPTIQDRAQARYIQIYRQHILTVQSQRKFGPGELNLKLSSLLFKSKIKAIIYIIIIPLALLILQQRVGFLHWPF